MYTLEQTASTSIHHNYLFHIGTSDTIMVSDAFTITFRRYTYGVPNWYRRLGPAAAAASGAQRALDRFDDICEKLELVAKLQHDSDSDENTQILNSRRAEATTSNALARSTTLSFHKSRLYTPPAVWTLQCSSSAAATVYVALRGTETFDRSSLLFFTRDKDARTLQWNDERVHAAPTHAIVHDLIKDHTRDFAADGFLAVALRLRGIFFCSAVDLGRSKFPTGTRSKRIVLPST